MTTKQKKEILNEYYTTIGAYVFDNTTSDMLWKNYLVLADLFNTDNIAWDKLNMQDEKVIQIFDTMNIIL